MCCFYFLEKSKPKESAEVSSRAVGQRGLKKLSKNKAHVLCPIGKAFPLSILK